MERRHESNSGGSLFTRAFLLPLGNVRTLRVLLYRLLLAHSALLLSLPVPCPPRGSRGRGEPPPLPAPGAPFLLLELASCSWRCFSCSWSSFPAPGALFLLLGLLPFSWNSFPFPGVLFLLERGSLFKPGFNAALRFVVQHKEGYSWREKGLRGWEQYWVCSCSPSAWKVYRSPKERGGKFFF